MERTRQKLYEDEAYILDIFPPKRVGRGSVIERNMNIAHMLGTSYFTLLEAAVNTSLNLKVGMRTYIGRDIPRDMIRVIRRINYNELSENAKLELEKAVETIVMENKERYVNFFNECGPLTPRLHSLEVIPGIGKKLMLKILEERERQPFNSFDDLKERVGIPDPDRAVIRRILEELSNPSNRYWLFVRAPSQASHL